MKRLGMNQTDLAKRMQVSRPYITKLMSGDVNITFETALRLAKAVKMDFMPQLRDMESKEIVADEGDLSHSLTGQICDLMR